MHNFVKVKVSRPIHPGVRHPSGTRDQFFPLLSLIILLMWGALSDEKSGLYFSVYVGRHQIIRSESHGTNEHSLLTVYFRLIQPGGPGSRIYFLPRTG
jgi:hypothetical protein